MSIHFRHEKWYEPANLVPKNLDSLDQNVISNKDGKNKISTVSSIKKTPTFREEQTFVFLKFHINKYLLSFYGEPCTLKKCGHLIRHFWSFFMSHFGSNMLPL